MYKFLTKLTTNILTLKLERETHVPDLMTRIRILPGVAVVAQKDKVARFLGAAGVIAMPAQGNNPKKAMPKKKAQERLAAAKEAEAAPAEAALAEEAPAEEASAEAALAEEAPAEEEEK